MGWLQAIYAVFAAIREFFSWKRSADDRQAGADAANNATRAQNDARVKEANEAEIEADRAHKTMPGDEAFDNEFRRD
jgi:hypothetical protein